MWRHLEADGSSVDTSVRRSDAHTVRAYLGRQLRRRGFHHPSRRAEALELGLHLFAVARWQAVGEGDFWATWQRSADRAVYLAIKELRQRTAAIPRLEARTVIVSQEDRFEEPSIDLEGRIERLPTALRLLVKLKLAGIFLPGLNVGQALWRTDEAEFLSRQHEGRSLASIEEELRGRLANPGCRSANRMSSTTIAWLLGRASAAAVDTAYREVKATLRKQIENGTSGPRGPVIKTISPTRAAAPRPGQGLDPALNGRAA